MSAILKYEKNDPTLPRDYLKLKSSYHKVQLQRAAPKDESIQLDPKKYLLSKTDPRGNIEYCNSYFVKISGYSEKELVGKPHSIVRHPDMPSAVYELMWEHLHRRKNIYMLMKNMAKDGRYYWVGAEFNIKVNKAIDELQGYFAYQKPAPAHALPHIEAFYQKLKAIEEESGTEASYKYLQGFLEERHQSWNEYMDDLVNTSFAKKLSNLRRKLFSSEPDELILVS
ncbi:MAG TPA: PAS domain S-box protein [Epsilonproteobacteria bacterium]|nr:PAS domain S-box protein [Campylobacterota bacterium]